ncbi:MAG TPA: hypothetical protein VG604_02730, partial [Candidatus Saccharimonadales bacterium]|nr:hypothetical protein [Candidatus Saccharimonadales bacterium]
AKDENIQVSDEALQLIAEHASGSFRDSVSLLDQASSHGDKVEADNVRQLLGIPPTEAVVDLLKIVSAGGEPAKLVSQLEILFQQGYQAATIAKQLGQLIRGKLVAGQTSETQLKLLTDLLDVPVALDPARYLEICLLRALPQTKHDTPFAEAEAIPEPQTMDEAPLPEQPEDLENVVEVAEEPLVEEAKETPAEKTKKTAKSQTLNDQIWPEVLAALKQRHNTLYSVARMAQPRFSGDGSLELAVAFGFHQKRLNETENRQRLSGIIKDLTGQAVTISAIVDKAVEKSTAPIVVSSESVKAVTPSTELTTISNIFGGGELIES